MSALFYLIRKQLKNIVRGLTSKPLALVGYIFIGMMIVGSLIAVLAMPSGIVRHASNELFSAIFTGLIVVLMYFTLKQGIEKGSSYFRYSDVNLIFPAPIKSNKVLLYGFIKRLGTSVLIVMFSLFQLPNIKNNFVLQDYGVWVILLSVLLYSLLGPIPGMLLYTFTSVSNKRRVMTKRVLDALAILFALGFLVQLFSKVDFLEACIRYLNSDFFIAIPIVGQLRVIATAAVYGIDAKFYYSIIILIVLIVAFIVVLYKADPDYYEDVLIATDQIEQRIKAKREGKGNDVNKKARKIKGSFLSSGARAIFDKHLLEYRKMSYLLFFDKSSLFIVIFGIMFKFLMPNEVSSIFFTLFFSAYMLFFFSVQGKWPMELEKPYIFMIPESNTSKLLYCTMTENIKNLLDGTLLFVIAFFLYKTSPVVIVLCIISYTLYGAIYIYGDVLCRRLFGSVHSKAMLTFIKLFVSLFVVIPGIILMVILSYGLKDEIIAVFAVTAWNFAAAAILFLLSKGVLSNIEVSK